MNILDPEVHLLAFCYEIQFVNEYTKISIPFQTLSNLTEIVIK